jgi:hypothetical protein
MMLNVIKIFIIVFGEFAVVLRLGVVMMIIAVVILWVGISWDIGFFMITYWFISLLVIF